jgi:hypothetical protein
VHHADRRRSDVAAHERDVDRVLPHAGEPAVLATSAFGLEVTAAPLLGWSPRPSTTWSAQLWRSDQGADDKVLQASEEKLDPIAALVGERLLRAPAPPI